MVGPWGKVTVPWSGLPISVYEDLGWWGTVVVEAGLDKHSRRHGGKQGRVPQVKGWKGKR